MKTRWMVAAALLIAGCATVSDTGVSDRAREVMQQSFKSQGQATLDRLHQDNVQAYCSKVASGAMALESEVGAKLEKSQAATIKYPADGSLMGDWREGEKIAQSGVGKQYSDNPAVPAGGNCYACHQFTKEEVSYGTLGPSLNGYGKLRGQSVDMQRYTYGKIYNPQAYTACSNMPRFGHNGILTEQQLKNLVALLLDPQSPVNR